MKKAIIILLALVVFMAVPVFASTPEQENAPVMSEDEIFLSDLFLLSEEQLIEIVGNYITSTSITHDTDACTPETMKQRELERQLLYFKLYIETKSKFQWSQAFWNALYGALTGVIAQLASQYGTTTILTESIIKSGIIAASVSNPILAAALAGAGIGYLTYLVNYYLSS